MKILDELRRHLIPLTAIEFSRLEENIIEQGCATVPLVYWHRDGETILLDGHNRYEICKANNLPFDTRDVNEHAEIVSDIEAAKDWIDRNQLGRRNLDPVEFEAIAGRIYNRRKKAEHDGGKGVPRSGGQLGPHSTAKEVGDEVGVSERTIKRYGQRAEVVDKLLDAGEVEAAEVAKRAPQAEVAAVKDDSPQDAAKKLMPTAAPVAEWSPEEVARREAVESGETVVANKKKDLNLIAWAVENNCFVPIDRRSPWGNPFILDEDGNRETVCESYEVYIQYKPSLISKIDSIKGCVLGCWCYPERCHGDHLVSLTEASK